jgi:hypothetical protein
LSHDFQKAIELIRLLSLFDRLQVYLYYKAIAM